VASEQPRQPDAARPAAKKLRKIGKGAATKVGLREALQASAAALGESIAAAEGGGKLKGAKRGPAAFTGYVLAHEAHHRGQIILHLKYAKMPVDAAFGYSIWEWEKDLRRADPTGKKACATW
jgi:hypothetical protein